ncbi:MAG: UDP-N-acetylmuramate--L-alanine ligase [Fusobacteriaceae bacterium]
MKKIYFIGINGIGMSGLAKIMKIKGFEVSGADLSRSYVTEELENMGITVFGYHDDKNMVGIDTVIASSAIKDTNPEYAYALKNNIKIVKRGELLGTLINLETGIAVAGTHGKTTTSSMLSACMMSKDPTIAVGGILPEIGSNARPGTSEYFIAEADESDNSFLYMTPSYSIVTNIEADHLENHGSLENIKISFNKFLDQTKKEAIVCLDCDNIKEVIEGRENITTYSAKNSKANIFAKDIVIKAGKTEYTVVVNGESIGEFAISIPGMHNILNSLPVIYLSHKLGVETQEIKRALLCFKGAKRRYDILYDKGIKIIDDYAHHPTEIMATLQGVKSIEKNKVVAIFQPHRYSRVKFLIDKFENCFQGVEEVLLLPIYSAGEKDIYNVSLEMLKDKINHENSKIVNDQKEIFEIINSCKEDKVFLFMGAGNISSYAHEIVEKLEKNENI